MESSSHAANPSEATVDSVRRALRDRGEQHPDQGADQLLVQLRQASRTATELHDLLALTNLRKRAERDGLLCQESSATSRRTRRVALIGGATFYPLQEALQHLLNVEGTHAELFIGEFDNAAAEILDPRSKLYDFRPHVIVYLPSERTAHSTLPVTATNADHEQSARAHLAELWHHCATLHDRTEAEILLANYTLPPHHDLGSYRSRTLGSPWSYRKWLNLHIGLEAPAYVTIIDREFLGCRAGLLQSAEPRDWYQTRQPGSTDFVATLARETSQQILRLQQSPKKVLVLDLDNTLWGGVIGDDGIEGIDLGDTSPRGEAFKTFQVAIKRLRERGVLLCVASKNDEERAQEPFEKHPDMVLKLDDITCFKANWGPKSESIRQMSEELNLGLDSFVFVDDNPAEIDIVRQFCPEVETLLLRSDPSDYVQQLEDCRHFEPRQLTAEDAIRVQQYAQEVRRKELRGGATDMTAYLQSLQMVGEVNSFRGVDVPRIAQLINKSNQFNLTTRRRTEAEVRSLLEDPDHVGFTLRLSDRFGDYGLISIVVGKLDGTQIHLDTWLMSCRVLERQVEEEVLHEIVQRATQLGATEIRGLYLPTPKNSMVRDLYSRLGFELIVDQEDRREFRLAVAGYTPPTTQIQMNREVVSHG